MNQRTNGRLPSFCPPFCSTSLAAVPSDRRVEWHCDSRDSRGRKAAERYGFLLEGTLRKHRVDSRGCNVDTALYALTNSDWRDEGVKARLQAKLRAPSGTGISAPTRPVASISAEHHDKKKFV